MPQQRSGQIKDYAYQYGLLSNGPNNKQQYGELRQRG